VHESVDVQRIPEDGRNGIPEHPLFRLVIGPTKLDPDHAKGAKAFQHAANVRVDRKGWTIEGTHHHAGCTLRADLRQGAEELEHLPVIPGNRRLKGAAAELIDQCGKRELQTLRLSPTKAREADQLLGV
jgi:hypothetical protein